MLQVSTARNQITTSHTAPSMTRGEFFAHVGDGREFYVEFVKRTTGEMRQMYAHVDSDATTSPRDVAHGLVTVWDTEKDAPRCIPLDGIRFLDREPFDPADD